ncbi:MAG: ACT domain-containing protein, partial [Candidatus Rokuibacteriota bacterium]
MLTQLVLTLRSQPGVLASVTRALAEAGVNITALCAGDA